MPQSQRVIIIIARRYFYAKCGADGEEKPKSVIILMRESG